MNPWPDKETLSEIATLKSIQESFVEKDWLVTQIIRIIERINLDGFQIIFTGGTALSKAHKLIHRFSEDVDFRVNASPGTKRGSLSEFKHTIIAQLKSEGEFTIEHHHVTARDGNRFFAIEIEYNTMFTQHKALRPHVLIELAIRNTQLQSQRLPVSSIHNEVLNLAPEIPAIDCINPVESAADKLSALAWRIPDRIRQSQTDDPAVVRHIHDLAYLKELAVADLRFKELVLASMDQDRTRPRNLTSNASMTPNEKLQSLLKILIEDPEYPIEYDQFVKGVSYTINDQIPSFASAVEALRQLVEIVTKTDSLT